MQIELRIMVLLVAFGLSNLAFAEELFGRVVGVTDGDTVTVLVDGQNRQYEVRLFAIDSPETSCHQKRPSASDDACVEHGQPFGKAAKRSLSDLVYGQNVKVVLQRGESYGRAIGTIWVDGVNANLEQVRRGMAWHYKRYAAKEQTPADYDAFDQAEKSARWGRVGLWSSAGNAVAPWEYRHNKAQ